MFCEKCGKQINDDAAFCPYCGYTVGRPAESTVSVKAESTVKTSGRYQSIDLFGSSRMALCLGIGFALLVVLEVINWYFMSVKMDEYGVSYAYPGLWYRSKYNLEANIPSFFYLLLMPVVNLLLAAMFLTKKRVFYIISSVYGIIWSLLVIANYSYNFDPRDTRSIVVYAFALLLFIALLILLKTEKRISYIVTNVFAAGYSLLYPLLLTDVVFEISVWSVTSYRVHVFVSIVVTVCEMTAYSVLIWHIYRQASARNEG